MEERRSGGANREELKGEEEGCRGRREGDCGRGKGKREIDKRRGWVRKILREIEGGKEEMEKRAEEEERGDWERRGSNMVFPCL